jgi:hypothetical protein
MDKSVDTLFKNHYVPEKYESRNGVIEQGGIPINFLSTRRCAF